MQAVPCLMSSSARLGIATRSIPDCRQKSRALRLRATGRHEAGLPGAGVWPHAWDRRQRPGPPLQTYTAVYYVLADVLMLSLYFYYKFKKRPSPCEYGPLGVRGLGEAWEAGRSRCPVAGDTPNPRKASSGLI